ncbi:hypothetical protein RJT34_15348 [Clitoria ternatea]|uniref:Uncharacterized protein n=1 Tax=Clitoria ternatea TaxID=43366 RepID=A0AAN9PN38_CLITE
MQRLVDSEEKRDLGDPNSWSSETHSRLLFKDLVQILPLVQSFIDRKASSSFTRQGSIMYTKKPSRESLSKRRFDIRKGQKDEFVILKEKVEELQMKILKQDEFIAAAENTKKLMNALKEKLVELKRQASEKDSLLTSTQQQLYDVKFKLADKQAALEKIHWEAMTSNKKVEKLQEEIDSMHGDISLFTLLLEGLIIPDIAAYTDDYDIKAYDFNHLPSIDDLHVIEMQKMEEARKAYIAAVSTAKEKRDEESIATAAYTRSQLQSILFEPGISNV